MNLLRKYKIYKFLGKTDDKSKEIFNFVENKLSNLNIIKKVEYLSTYNFYINSNNEIIFEYNIYSKWLLISYENLYDVLKYKFDIDYYDICCFISFYINKIYKLETAHKTTDFRSQNYFCKINI